MEKNKKCEHCGAYVPRGKWYYHDGHYFCNRRCHKKWKKKQQETK